MTSHSKKLSAGVALLVICSVIVLALGAGIDLPLVVGSIGVLGLAAGALLVGTSEGGRPV